MPLFGRTVAEGSEGRGSGIRVDEYRHSGPSTCQVFVYQVKELYVQDVNGTICRAFDKTYMKRLIHSLHLIVLWFARKLRDVFSYRNHESRYHTLFSQLFNLIS